MNSAATFEILAGSTVTNTGPTIITGGDLGLSPGSAVTGFPPGTLTPPAVMHLTDPIAAQAQLDLTTAYNYAAGVQGAAVLPGDMSGLTFTPGVYKQDFQHGRALGRKCHARWSRGCQCRIHLPGRFDSDDAGIYSGDSGGKCPGQEHFLAGQQFSHSWDELRLPGKYIGTSIHHDGYRRQPDRESTGPKWGGHFGQQHHYRSITMPHSMVDQFEVSPPSGRAGWSLSRVMRLGGIVICHRTLTDIVNFLR